VKFQLYAVPPSADPQSQRKPNILY